MMLTSSAEWTKFQMKQSTVLSFYLIFMESWDLSLSCISQPDPKNFWVNPKSGLKLRSNWKRVYRPLVSHSDMILEEEHSMDLRSMLSCMMPIKENTNALQFNQILTYLKDSIFNIGLARKPRKCRWRNSKFKLNNIRQLNRLWKYRERHLNSILIIQMNRNLLILVNLLFPNNSTIIPNGRNSLLICHQTKRRRRLKNSNSSNSNWNNRVRRVMRIQIKILILSLISLITKFIKCCMVIIYFKCVSRKEI